MVINGNGFMKCNDYRRNPTIGGNSQWLDEIVYSPNKYREIEGINEF